MTRLGQLAVRRNRTGPYDAGAAATTAQASKRPLPRHLVELSHHGAFDRANLAQAAGAQHQILGVVGTGAAAGATRGRCSSTSTAQSPSSSAATIAGQT